MKLNLFKIKKIKANNLHVDQPYTTRNEEIVKEIYRLHECIRLLEGDSEVLKKYQLVFEILCNRPMFFNKEKAILELKKLNIDQYKIDMLIKWVQYYPTYLMSLMICLAKGMNEEQSWNIAMDV